MLLASCLALGRVAIKYSLLPGWEGRLGENGYMYKYGGVPSLFTQNCHDIVDQLYPNTK